MARPLSKADRLEETLEAYEAARSQGAEVAAADFAPAADDPDHAEILLELLRCELEFTHRDGKAVPLDEYLRRHPILAERRELLEELAFEEYRLRRQSDPSVTPRDYAAKYSLNVAAWPVWRGSADVLSSAARPSRSSGDVDADAQFPRPGERLGDFEIAAEIGRGAFARVYLARQHGLAQRFVALKITGDNDREHETLARLQHTHIVPIYSVHQTEFGQALCMPFLGVTTLRNVIDACGGGVSGQSLVDTVAARRSVTLPAATSPNDAAEAPRPAAAEPSATGLLADVRELDRQHLAVWLVAKVAAGLAYAHQHGVLHRDLKPANILIADDGEPLLLDFNLSSSLLDPESQRRVGGTLPYMAPEHLQSLATGEPLTAAADVFSLGVILHELVLGHRPFPDAAPGVEHLDQWREERREQPPTPPAWVSADLAAIMQRCLQADPRRRYPSAAELAEDLCRHQENRPLKWASGGSWKERLRKWSRRHPRWSSAYLVAALAAVLLAVVSLAAWRVRSHWRRADASLQAASMAEEAASWRLDLAAAPLESDGRLAAYQQATAWLEGIESHTPSVLPWLSSNAGDAWSRELALVNYQLSLTAAQLAEQDSGSATPAWRDAARDRLKAFERWAPAWRDGLAVRWQATRLGLDGQAASPSPPGLVADEESPQTAEDCFLLALMWRERKEPARALPLIERAVGEDPANFSYWFLTGLLQADVRQPARAEAAFTHCLALKDDSFWAHFHRGLARLQDQRPRSSLEDWNGALALRPGHAESLLNRALAMEQLGDLSGAVRDCSQALEARPELSRGYFLRSRLRAATGDAAGAAEDRRRALQLTPEDSLAWLARGAALAATERPAALASFREALELRPDSAMALQNCAALLSLDAATLPEAIAMMDRLIALEPDTARHYASRGVLQARLGRSDAALQDADAALQRDTTADTSYRVAGIFALLAEDPAHRQQALRLLRQAAWKEPAFVASLITRDDDLRLLREDAAFRELVSQLQQLHPRN